jgi:ABC-type Zn uptake system ZnuABC Zn-binding protein ZnuA
MELNKQNIKQWLKKLENIKQWLKKLDKEAEEYFGENFSKTLSEEEWIEDCEGETTKYCIEQNLIAEL